MASPIIRIGNTQRPLEAWEKLHQRELTHAKGEGVIPYCCCMGPGVPMEFFSRSGNVFVRRVKNTTHANGCEFGVTGKVVSMSRKQHEPIEGLLRRLWEVAELNVWHPGLTGKRNWNVVKGRIKAAIDNDKTFAAIGKNLFAPNVFSQDTAEQDAKDAQHQIDSIMTKQGSVMLLGEVKKVSASKYDSEVSILHLPQFRLWAKPAMVEDIRICDSARLVILADIKKSEKGNFYISSLESLQTGRNYLPISAEGEAELINTLAKSDLRFTVELKAGITTIFVKNPPARFWIIDSDDEAKHAYEASAGTGEIIVLIDKKNTNTAVTTIERFSGKQDGKAQVTSETLQFNDN